MGWGQLTGILGKVRDSGIKRPQDGCLCCHLLVGCSLGHASAPLVQVSVSTCEGDSHRLSMVQSLFSCCYDRILDKQQLEAGWGGVYFGLQFEGIRSAMVRVLWE